MGWFKSNARNADYKACASVLQWQYKDEDKGLLTWLLDFKLFKLGGGKKVMPVIIKEDDDLGFTCMFDYKYTVSTGKSSHTFTQTVFFKYSKAIALPQFLMVPEKWFHRVGTYFGMQDIDFMTYPEFSKNYLLQGEDEDYIRYHFNHPEMMRFFGLQDFYSMEGMNYLMVLYVNNKTLPKEQMIQLARIGNTLHNYFKGKTPSIELPAENEMDLPKD